MSCIQTILIIFVSRIEEKRAQALAKLKDKKQPTLRCVCKKSIIIILKNITDAFFVPDRTWYTIYFVRKLRIGIYVKLL